MITLKTTQPEAEEAAIISLAAALRRLGAFAAVEKDFIRRAERAVELGNYENLAKFPAIVGAVNLEDGNSAEAAKNFEQAITLTFWQIITFLDAATSEDVEPFSDLELPFVLSRLAGAIKKAI